MQNWRTNLGGALGALGTALIGFGVLPQLSGTPSKLLTYTAFVGFVISGFGKFFTALFAADAKSLAESHEELAAKVDNLTSTVTNLKVNQ